jgi:uncharacterized protein (TIGR02271 family)
VQTGVVRIEKHVTEREERVEPEVWQETLDVERVAVGQLVEGEPPTPRREGETLVIPVLEEVLVVRKQVRLKEEIRITRRRAAQRVAHSMTLRSEDVTVHRDAAHGGPRDATDTGRRTIMQLTLVGIYDDYEEAQRAQEDLVEAGFAQGDIELRRDAGGEAKGSRGIGGFFRSLFSDNDPDATMYSDALQRGNVVLSVTTPDEEQGERAIDVMNRHHPVDIDRLGYDTSGTRPPATAQTSGTSGTGSTSSTASTTGTGSATGMGAGAQTRIPVVKEEIAIGKRQVQRGGVRVYQRVVDRPVEQEVRLREEKIDVQRKPVNRPASAEDLAAFKEGTFELQETAEEAVVQKSARVVEEVEVGKTAKERTQRISEKVRETRVDVEPVSDEEYRAHWKQRYGSAGGTYDDYQPAYQFGADLAEDERYRGRQWADAEPDVRADWERKNPGSTWDKFKDSIRYAWARVTGKASRG